MDKTEKKLVQTRLPFAPANSKQNISIEPSLKNKKRKLSGPENVIKSPKSKKCEKKQQPNTKNKEKEILDAQVSEEEVSSSCDEIVDHNGTAAEASKHIGGKSQEILSNFINNKPTQQDEVSTSVEDDLNHSEDVESEITSQEILNNDVGDEIKGIDSLLNVEIISDMRTEDYEVIEVDDQEPVKPKTDVFVTPARKRTRSGVNSKNSTPKSNERKKRKSMCNKLDGYFSPKLEPSKNASDNQLLNKMQSPTTPKSSKSIFNTPKSTKIECVPDSSKSDSLSEKGNESTTTDDGSHDDTSDSANTSNASKISETLNSSTTSTPKSSKKSSLPKKLTPLQAEKQKKKEEREQLRIEKLKKKEEAEEMKRIKKEELAKKKEELAKKKEEEKKQKEEERIKKEEEKKKKDEEKKRKDEEREEERKKKEDEKKKKEEEKQKKVEEKQKKEEEKRQLEEEERQIKEKSKALFKGFFVKKEENEPDCPDDTPDVVQNITGPFMQFQLRDHMFLAPLHRNELSGERKETLDKHLSKNIQLNKNYLQLLRSQEYNPGKISRTLPLVVKKDEEFCEIIDNEDEEEEEALEEEEENIIKIIDENKTQKIKAKMLKFCENNRPAYWGTWQKKSKYISGRRPFGQDLDVFNYDYDSDDDWEEEEAGESLSDSEGEDKEDKDEDNYEVDNDFFVPHGYLSDDEANDDEEEEEEENTNKPEDKKDPLLQSEELKMKQKEFEEELKKPTKELKPRILGCHWLHDTLNKNHVQLMKIFSNYATMSWCDHPIPTFHGGEIPQEVKEKEEKEKDDEKSNSGYLKSFPETAVPRLIKLMHGNKNSVLFLVKEFAEYWKNHSNENCSSDNPSSTPSCDTGLISINKINQKIHELATYTKDTDEGLQKHKMWYVNKEILEKYNLSDLTIENTWVYTLKPKEKREEATPTTEVIEESPKPTKATPTNLITKFAKVLTEEERIKNRILASKEVKSDKKESKLTNSSDDIEILNNKESNSSLTEESQGTLDTKENENMNVDKVLEVVPLNQKTNKSPATPKTNKTGKRNSIIKNSPVPNKSSKLSPGLNKSLKASPLPKTPKNSVGLNKTPKRTSLNKSSISSPISTNNTQSSPISTMDKKPKSKNTLHSFFKSGDSPSQKPVNNKKKDDNNKVNGADNLEIITLD